VLRTISDIQSDFAFLDEWEDRYRYVIELGRELPDLSDAERNERTKVPGCVSQVWLVSEPDTGSPPRIRFRGESDAHITRGLVAIVLALYSGRTADEILLIDAEGTFAELGLAENLTPQRSNGLRSMVRRIREDAEIARSHAA